MKFSKFNIKNKLDFLSVSALLFFMFFQIFDVYNFSVQLSAMLFIFFSILSLLCLSYNKPFEVRVSDLFFILFLLSMMISVLFNIDRYESLFSPLFWVFGVAISYFWGGFVIRWPKILIIPGMIGFFIFCFMYYMSGFDLIEVISGRTYLKHMDYLINPNRMSTFVLVSLFFISIYFCIDNNLSFFKKIIIGLILILFLFSILSTGSRAGLGTAISLIFLVLYKAFMFHSKKGYYLLNIFSVSIIIISPLFIFLIFNLVIAGIIYSSGRDVIWKVALDFWSESAIIGLGYGQAVNVLSSFGIHLSVHNAFIQLLVEGGVFSIFLFFCFIFSLTMTNLDQSKSDIAQAFTFLFVVLIIIQQNFETVIFHISPYSFLFFSFLGWIVRRRSASE